MITSRLKIIFALSIPVFIAHGIEEIATGFYAINNHVHFLFAPLSHMSNSGASFVTFQVMLWLILIVAFILLLGEKWQFRTLALLGLIYLYEFYHLIGAIVVGGYYPGLLTSLVFPILAYFFWKEWLRVFKRERESA